MAVIAPMEASDVGAVLTIGEASFQGGTMTEANVREELARPWARIWTAREEPGADIVAFLLAWFVVDEVHVLNVATEPKRRRRGIARALMDHVIGFARDHGARHVLLEVRRSNVAAIALYRTLGFFAMGVRRAYYPDGEDAVEMVLLFDEKTRAVVTRPDEVRLENRDA